MEEDIDICSGMYRAKLIPWIFVAVVENMGSNPIFPTD
jgi:hypothetical protein